MTAEPARPASEPAWRRTRGWLLPGILLGLYLLLKLEAWGLARGVRDLERELGGLRPALSQKVWVEQLRRVKAGFEQGYDKIQAMDLRGASLLEQLSQRLPLSVAVDGLFAGVYLTDPSSSEIRLNGSFFPGVRDPERVLIPCLQKIFKPTAAIRIRRIMPPIEKKGAWHFRAVIRDA